MGSRGSFTIGDLIAWIIAKDKPRHHVRRYILGAALSVTGCITLAGAYMTLLPPAYISRWSLIVPGAGADTRVSLDRLGQAQSTSNSPFSDKVLSPKVTYKEIATSEPVIAETARLSDIEPEELTKPSIKLIDQSSIIELQITAPTPDEAQRRAWAHFKALRARLDFLRDDELKARNQALRSNITEVEVGLKQARERLLDLQKQTGLASPEQYNQLVSAIETMRKEQEATKIALAEKSRQVDAIRTTLRLSPEQAALIVRASASPELRRLAVAHATTNALHAEMHKRFGTGHPRVIDLRNKLSSIANALSVARPSGLEHLPQDMMDVALSAENERFIGMLTDLVARDAELKGQLSRLAELEQSISDLEKRRLELASVSAKLDDLQRDHLIANTVFSSALARLDAGKAEQYASYPVLQMMSEPTLPEHPSSPRFLFALLGAAGGALLSCIGWLFAWLHQLFLFQRLERRFLPAPLGAGLVNGR